MATEKKYIDIRDRFNKFESKAKQSMSAGNETVARIEDELKLKDDQLQSLRSELNLATSSLQNTQRELAEKTSAFNRAVQSSETALNVVTTFLKSSNEALCIAYGDGTKPFDDSIPMDTQMSLVDSNIKHLISKLNQANTDLVTIQLNECALKSQIQQLSAAVVSLTQSEAATQVLLEISKNEMTSIKIENNRALSAVATMIKEKDSALADLAAKCAEVQALMANCIELRGINEELMTILEEQKGIN